MSRDTEAMQRFSGDSDFRPVDRESRIRTKNEY